MGHWPELVQWQGKRNDPCCSGCWGRRIRWTRGPPSSGDIQSQLLFTVTHITAANTHLSGLGTENSTDILESTILSRGPPPRQALNQIYADDWPTGRFCILTGYPICFSLGFFNSSDLDYTANLASGVKPICFYHLTRVWFSCVQWHHHLFLLELNCYLQHIAYCLNYPS